MHIRPMTAADLDAVAQIEISAPDPWNKKQLEEELASEFARCLVLCDEAGTVAGFCTVQVAAGEASLNAITVDPACRGRGYGRALLAELCACLAAEGVGEIYLEVRTQNAPAIALYQHFGFEVTGLRKRFYKKPDDDAIVMKYTF